MKIFDVMGCIVWNHTMLSLEFKVGIGWQCRREKTDEGL